MQASAPAPPEAPRGAGVLVLCTGNSARSQMAAGFLQRAADGRFPVYSAGTEPAAAVHPMAVEAMREKGIDLRGATPTHLSHFLGKVPIHTVMIVCDGAAKSCPATWPGARERLLWPFEDPAAFAGDDAEKLEKFRQVRDEIEAKVELWAAAGGTDPRLGGAAADG